jgi:hypothetical protein
VLAVVGGREGGNGMNRRRAIIRGRILDEQELAEALATCECSGCVAERFRDQLSGVRSEMLDNLARQDCSPSLTADIRNAVSKVDDDIRLLWLPAGSASLN